MNRRSRAVLVIVVAAAALAAAYWAVDVLIAKRGGDAGLSNSFRLEIALPDPNTPPPTFGQTLEDFPIFKALQFETITLTIRSERRGVLHLHGYEKKIDLVPHGEVTLTFVAENAGLFPVHLHDDDSAMEHLATFEIQPR